MPINLKTAVVESREQRLGTIVGGDRKASDLSQKSAYARGCGSRCGDKACRVCELDWWGLPVKFAVIGYSGYNLALTHFLVNQLGLIPGRQIITDNPPNEVRENILPYCRHTAEDVSTGVDFEEGSYTIHQKDKE